MIRGKSIRLRTVRETDLDRLYSLLTDIAHRSDFVPLHIPSEATFKRQFHETGFWSEDYGRFLIVNTSIWRRYGVGSNDDFRVLYIKRGVKR